jgi:hypothetical protein
MSQNTMNTKKIIFASLLLAGAINASAEELVLDTISFASTPTIKASGSSPVYLPWMHTDVSAAWNQGYTGQGTTTTVVDDFSSNNRIAGKWTTTKQSLRHGEWTSSEIALMAPSATVKTLDYSSGGSFTPVAGGLNVINASYGLMAPRGYQVSQINFGTLQNSVINAAKQGTAIVVKAAGNSAVAVNGVTGGKVDYLNMALRGAPTAIYVGALDRHGSPTNKARLASYSNFAGTDAVIQNQFVVVGVPNGLTGLAGTSFAAPALSAYSNIIGSKFKTASATQITNQILNTARKDTIFNYSKAVHGRGEASLSRALAPSTIK